MRLDRTLKRLPTTSGEERDELLNRVCHLVFTHAFAEEAVLWPALRHSLDDGEELTSRVEQERQEITELVARLEQTPPNDPERAGFIDQTIALLRQDGRDEGVSASNGLGAAARRIERPPPLRRGERPETHVPKGQR